MSSLLRRFIAESWSGVQV